LSRAELLARAQQLAAARLVTILRNPQQDMENLEYDFDDVCDCIQTTRLEDVEKEMEDQYRDDRTVLVFRPIRYGEDELYLKVSVATKSDEELVVLSFKLWGSPR
jgi:hypothetical protein